MEVTVPKSCDVELRRLNPGLEGCSALGSAEFLRSGLQTELLGVAGDPRVPKTLARCDRNLDVNIEVEAKHQPDRLNDFCGGFRLGRAADDIFAQLLQNSAVWLICRAHKNTCGAASLARRIDRSRCA